MNIILTSLIDTEQNHSLPNGNVESTIFGTNSLNGNRNRYTSGLFLPQIYTSTGEHRPRSNEFAVRSIRGNKAFLRTNNASLFSEVVEAVSHPFKGVTFPENLFTKTLNTMKNPTYTANSGIHSPVAFTFNNGGNA